MHLADSKDHMATNHAGVPRGTLSGLTKHWKSDVISGFLVFLIALPLCLGISLASGYPAIAGVFTAIIGSVLTTFLSNSELTIKGPAAGLIVIALGTVTEFTAIYGDAGRAYRMALGVGVAAGVIQLLFGLSRVGILGEFFPTSAVHGMLAAIGVIIMSKQIHITLGVQAQGKEPLELIAEIPASIRNLNPEIATIGLAALAILYLLPLVRNRYVRMIPGPMLVLLVTVPIGMYFNLEHEHTYSFLGHDYRVGENFLVSVPGNLINAMTFPEFDALRTFAGVKWTLMFALIGTLESLLSAKAVDLIDPYQRKTDLNRDLLAIGAANTVAAFVGGLPMISEIVRSRANIDNGAKTRFADMFHGLFMLAFVALLPAVIHRIPLAALSAMLVYTGFRLASPKEFIHVAHIGREQLVIFVATLVGVLMTDLLVGIAIGIAVKFLIHIINGVPLRSLFRPYLEVETRPDNTCVIVARQSAVFSNWIPFKHQIEQLGMIQRQNVVVDLSDAALVDSSVMEKLHQLQSDFEKDNLRLEIVGLDVHRQFSSHPFATRSLSLQRIRRLTIVADAALEQQLIDELIRAGATGYTSIPCHGAGRRGLSENGHPPNDQVRLEVVAQAPVCDRLLAYLRKEVMPNHPVTACVETVKVFRPEDF
jgi:MFS superfamily sulfate permease-like transporter